MTSNDENERIFAEMSAGAGGSSRRKWFPSYTQKKSYLRLLDEQTAYHADLEAELEKARGLGLTWPAHWSDEHREVYLRGPEAEALRLQAEIDGKREFERNERLRPLIKARDALQAELYSLNRARTYPETPTWTRRYDATLGEYRSIREEIARWVAEDWQDQVKRRRWDYR